MVRCIMVPLSAMRYAGLAGEQRIAERRSLTIKALIGMGPLGCCVSGASENVKTPHRKRVPIVQNIKRMKNVTGVGNKHGLS